MSVGVAFFDDHANSRSGGGWMSVAGGRAVRFNGFPDLDPQILWITDMEYMDFTDQGLGRSANLRNASFFKTSLAMMTNDFGMYDASIPEMAEAISSVSFNIIELTRESFPGIRFVHSLPDSIYQYLRINDERDDAASLYQPHFQSAFQENSQVAGSGWTPGGQLIKLSMNKVDFAEEVLSYPYPSGAWRDEISSMSAEEFIDLKVPAIAAAKIDLSGADVPDLLAFGVQISGTALIREWLTQPEAAMLLKSGAKIRISNIIRGTTGGEDIELPMILTSNPLIRTSYSAGIVAECFLHAVTSKRRLRNPGKNSRNQYFYPARAIYLKSIDRMISFGLAKQMADRNYIVKNYGMGSVSILATADIYVQAIQDAADLGFSICSSKVKIS